jgi:glycosyltransferase involved in cell wall biosynthesis
MSSPGGNGNGSPRGRVRVLHVGKFYPPEMGGMETHLQSLCEGLHGHVDVRVLVASRGRGHKVERIRGVQVTRLGTALTLAGAPICPWMISLLRESDADVVHLHLPNPAAVLAFLASGSRARLVVSYHSDVVRQRALDAAFRPFLFSLLNRAEAILASSPNYLESSRVLTRYRSRCQVVPYGIPCGAPAAASEEVERLRDRYGSRLVVSVGRLVYYKGFETLIAAMEHVEGRLLIVGDGPMRRRLELQARALGVDGRVTFLGGVEDVTPFCQAADVFVLASVARSEAFGIVQLEAMACGTPVVNTSLDSGVPFVSRHGESGITVPPRHPAALAAAINKLLDDPHLREAYGRAARERVEHEFTRERMIESMLGVYQGVLGAGSPVSPRRGRRPAGRAAGPPPARLGG